MRDGVLDFVVPELSPFLRSMQAAFASASKRSRRSTSLWRTLKRQASEMCVSSVREDLRERVTDLAVANAMAITLLDDIIDVDNDLQNFDRLSALYVERIGAARSGVEFDDRDEASQSQHERALSTIGAAICAAIDELPGARELRSLLAFDLAQVMTAMRYDWLFREHKLSSSVEYLGLFHDFSITIVWVKTLELCASPSFDRSELSAVRELALLTQRAWVYAADRTTWRTELAAGEWLCGAAKQAIVRGLLRWEDIEAERCDTIAARVLSCGVLAVLDDEIEQCFARLEARAPQLRSIDGRAWVEGVRNVVALQRRADGRL